MYSHAHLICHLLIGTPVMLHELQENLILTDYICMNPLLNKTAFWDGGSENAHSPSRGHTLHPNSEGFLAHGGKKLSGDFAGTFSNLPEWNVWEYLWVLSEEEDCWLTLGETRWRYEAWGTKWSSSLRAARMTLAMKLGKNTQHKGLWVEGHQWHPSCFCCLCTHCFLVTVCWWAPCFLHFLPHGWGFLNAINVPMFFLFSSCSFWHVESSYNPRGTSVLMVFLLCSWYSVSLCSFGSLCMPNWLCTSLFHWDLEGLFHSQRDEIKFNEYTYWYCLRKPPLLNSFLLSLWLSKHQGASQKIKSKDCYHSTSGKTILGMSTVLPF